MSLLRARCHRSVSVRTSAAQLLWQPQPRCSKRSANATDGLSERFLAVEGAVHLPQPQMTPSLQPEPTLTPFYRQLGSNSPSWPSRSTCHVSAVTHSRTCASSSQLIMAQKSQATRCKRRRRPVTDSVGAAPCSARSCAAPQPPGISVSTALQRWVLPWKKVRR